MENKRWYDKDSTVSLAVSVLRNAPAENQLAVADFVIKKAQELNIKPNSFSLKEFFNFKRRWYDANENVKNAMEYLKASPDDVQKMLALEIIDYLYSLDSIEVK